MSAQVYATNADRQRAYRARKAAAAGRVAKSDDPYLDDRGIWPFAEECHCEQRDGALVSLPVAGGTCLLCGHRVKREAVAA